MDTDELAGAAGFKERQNAANTLWIGEDLDEIRSQPHRQIAVVD